MRTQTVDGQAAQQADDRQLRAGKVVNHSGDVVLDERFSAGAEKRDDVLVVDRVRSDETHVERLVAAFQRHPAQPETDGAILFLGKRFRIDDAHLDHPVRSALVLAQQPLYTSRIAVDSGKVPRQALGKIETDSDWLLEGPEYVARALRKRKKTIFGKVDSRSGEHGVAENIHGKQQH